MKTLDPDVAGFIRRAHPSSPELLQAEPNPQELELAMRRAQCQELANQIRDTCQAARRYFQAARINLAEGRQS